MKYEIELSDEDVKYFLALISIEKPIDKVNSYDLENAIKTITEIF